MTEDTRLTASLKKVKNIRQYVFSGRTTWIIPANKTKNNHHFFIHTKVHAHFGKKYNANVKVVEVPPGPPVLSPLVAEVYGLDYNGQMKVAKAVREVFSNTDDIVDVDDSIEVQAEKVIVKVDQQYTVV